jgi:hypothetical protein
MEEVAPSPRSSWIARRIQGTGPPGRALGAFLIYATVSGVIYVRDVFAHFGTWCVGGCHSDTMIYLWSLRWMPFALRNGLNPLFTTHYLWAPGGINLVWNTTIPGPSFVLTPVTSIWGPLAGENLIIWLAPALAGWACYLLCLQLTNRVGPALAGGAMFAFSSYVGHHVRGHANLLLMFCVPLAAYLVARHVRGGIGPRALVLLLSLTLLGQFSVSTEIFATTTLFGGIALLLAIAFATPVVRRALLSTTFLIGIAYLVVIVILSPYLLQVIRSRPLGSVRPLVPNTADLLSYVLPRSPTWLGAGSFIRITRQFPGLAQDDTAYVGPAILVVIGSFAWFGRRSRWTWMVLAFVLVPIVFSLGPTLHVAGRASIPMPGAILAKVPILSSALPERFPLFAWVGIAVIVSLFLAQAEGQLWRWAFVFLGLVTIAVALPSPPYRTPLITPAFFADGTYRTYLRQGENDLLLPANVGDEMQWQEAADFWFRQSRGYIGPSHPEGQIGNPGGSIAYADHSADVITPAPANFLLYLHQQEIASVILPAPAPAAWDELLTSLGAERIVTGGVTLYRAPSSGWPQTVP